MTNDDVAIKSLFRLDIPDPGKLIEIYDEIDYVGAGDDIDDFVGVLDISGPSGTIYENTDFGSPDIIPATSRKIIPLVYLILDPQNDYWPMQGQYTIRYTIQNTITLDEYYKTFVYGFHFDGPVMSLDVDSGPYSAKLRSTDLTDYGSDIDTLVREHRIQYPTNAPGSPPDIISTNAFIEVDPIYTNLWTSSVKTTVDYLQLLDDLWYTWYDEIIVEHCVMGACIDSMYTALDTMYQQYLDYLGVNKVKAEVYMERLIRANTAFMLLDIAWRANDVEEADKQAAIIQEVIELSGISDCDPAGSSVLVNPCPPWGGSGVTPPSYTFRNGITDTASVVELGGTLVKSTNINVAAYSLTIGGTSVGKSASLFIDPAAGVAQLSSDNGSIAGRVYAEYNRVLLSRVDIGTPANTRQYEITSTGMVESADYSAGYVNLNLVSKLYVDNLFSGIDPYTFEQGLTKASTVVKLGGSITEDVILTSESYGFVFEHRTSWSGGAYSAILTVGDGTIKMIGYDDVGYSSTGGFSEIRVQNAQAFMNVYNDSSVLQQILITETVMKITDNINSKGIVYNADYSTNYTDRSLVDKGYVDGLVAGLVTAFTELTDTPSSYSGAANYFVKVNATAGGLIFSATGGWVPDTGGTFTGQVIHKVNDNYSLVIQRDGVAGNPGTPDASINRIQFRDSDNDIQGYIGIDGSGNISLYTAISGGVVLVEDHLSVQGDIAVTGLVDTVDVAAFKVLYDAHIVAANPHGTNMEDLADVPAYAGNQYKIPRINTAENGIEWVASTDSDKYYLHNQSTPSISWVCPHNLNKYPSVTIMDASGNIIEADNVQHTSLTSTTITMSESISGTAAFN